MRRGSLLLLFALMVQITPADARPRAAAPAGVVPFIIAAFDSARRFDANRLGLPTTNFGTIAYDLRTFDRGLEYPRGSGHSVLFATGLWVGARVGGVPRVTVAEYSSEWRPGRLFGIVPEPTSGAHLRSWKMRPAGAWRAPADSARVVSPGADDPLVHDSWIDYLVAHPLSDAPIRPVRLPDPASPGDSMWRMGPDLPGDLALWSTYNDADPSAHSNDAGNSPPLGMEVRQSVFGFEQTPSTVAFVRWQLFHHGEAPLDSAYVTFWVDPDLGGASDDLVGWDPALQMGYAYNETNADNVYGARPPAVGVRFLGGPGGPQAGAFNKYIGGTDPDTATVTYDLMRGLHLNGEEWIDPGTMQPSRFPFSGDPVTGSGWLDTISADRRFLVSAGPFDLAAGDSAEFLFAVIVGGGRDRLDSIERLRCQARLAGDAADGGFAPLFPSRLALAEATSTASEVRIVWTAEGARPRRLDVRRHPGGFVAAWPETSSLIARLLVDANGRLALVDGKLPPGERWTYGLFEPCDPLEPISRVTLDGPGAPLEFRIVSPAAAGPLRVFLTLSAAGSARFEAFAVDGRRLLDRALGRLPHGPQVLELAGTEGWPNGLYFLRLTQGGIGRTARVVFVR